MAPFSITAPRLLAKSIRTASARRPELKLVWAVQVSGVIGKDGLAGRRIEQA